MINTRIGISLMSIAAALALAGGAAFAFFSDTANSTGNTFTTGTLEINITDQNADTLFETENIVSDWEPGDQTFVNFDVKNTGSLPINIRGFASGTWGNATLDAENRVKVIRVERWDSGLADWDEILANTSGIVGLFYDTDGGLISGTAFVVNSGERAQYRLTVELDPDTGNDFQNKVFTSSISVEAKQTSATWL